MKTNEADAVTFLDILAAQQVANLQPAARPKMRACDCCGRLVPGYRCAVGGCSVDPFAEFDTTTTA